MKNTILLSFLVFINCSNVEQKEKIENVKKTIELSIKRSSSCVNKMIRAINEKKLKGIDNTNELKDLYDKSYITIKACRKLIEDLENIDSKIDLQKEGLSYIKFCENGLTKFFKPIIETSMQNLSNNTKLLREMFVFIQSGLETSQKMNDSLLEFCQEHGLKKEIEEFDKTKFDDKISEIEKIVK
ncbi:hypothetical protein [Tenacibaculum sp. 190524A05c]|uniref:hypothetical protein n=1 Tax=Tenacibaculum platacis TaxID=3137852 RepID=UPI0032B18F55